MGRRFVNNDGIQGIVKDSDPDLAYAISREREEQTAAVRFAATRAKVVRQDPAAQLPSQPYAGDAGFDLHYCGSAVMQLAPNQLGHVPSRVAVQWPEGVWGFIIGRSSVFQRGLLVNPTIIDAGWRGELFAYVRNVSQQWIEIEPGDRVAQIIPMPLLAAHISMTEVDRLDPSERGVNGFGSSGR